MTKPFVHSIILVLALSVAQNAVVAAPQKCDEQKDKEKQELNVTTEKNKFGHRALKSHVIINASPKVVWDAIREHRDSDPDVQYSKMTILSEKEHLLEQKYTSLPVFGAATCTLKLEEEKYKRIDYCLLKSDRLKEFEGTWILSSEDGGESTKLELSNHLRLHLPIPQRLIDAFAGPKLKSRLAFVKKLAETKRQSQIASKE